MAPVGSIVIPLTLKVFATTLPTFTVAGRERVYTPLVAFALTETWFAVPTTLEIKLSPYYSVCCTVFIK